MTFNLSLKNVDRRANNPEISSTAKINKHITAGNSMSTICSFLVNMENKHNLYREEDYHAIHRYAKNKYMKDHGKNKE